ncbi:MAG: DUF6178 family protein [Desulfatiglandales bacterium]
MKKKPQNPGADRPAPAPVPGDEKGLLQGIRTLSGRDIIQNILELDNPREAVRRLPEEDFYWMVKKVGDQDAVLLLELASKEQWQYLLDLEIWDGDRVDVAGTGAWLERLEQADSARLVQWLFKEGEYLAYYHLFRSLEVLVIENQEEVWEVPDGFFSLDGVYYLRGVDPGQRPAIERLLRVMADEDSLRFQSLILGLAGVLPADLEEEMYRLRNVRLAEHGFLPYEEAVAIYSSLDPSRLAHEHIEFLPRQDVLKADGVLVPSAPLEHVDAGNLLTEAVSSTPDPELLDRVRLEFAGLCNQILSADRTLSPDLDALIKVCRKASSYVNLGLERLCGKDRAAVEQALTRHSLVSLFQVGFGLALKIKWEAEKWLKGSWFASHGLEPEFWGEYWGGVLAGIMEPRPRFFVGQREGDEAREFQWLSDLAQCLTVVRRIMVLDGLLARLAEIYPPGAQVLQEPDLTFRPLLFNLWARRKLKASPSFSALTPSQAKRFMERLRSKGRDSDPPYSMAAFEGEFVDDFLSFAGDSDSEAASILREALVLIWQEFQEEHQWLSPEDMDGRYSKFITIRWSGAER